MAFEFQTPVGVLLLRRKRSFWFVEINEQASGPFPTPGAAAAAVARHRSGIAEWDTTIFAAPDDLLDWRPLGDSL
jgi:hypothetical protein